MNKIKIDKLNNSLDIIFDDTSKFDQDILNTLCDKLSELKQNQIININCEGFIFIEVAVYLLEVSKVANIIINLDKDDDKALRFLKHTPMFIQNSKLQVKIKK